MTVSRLLKSCAMPPVNRPMRLQALRSAQRLFARRSACPSRGKSERESPRVQWRRDAITPDEIADRRTPFAEQLVVAERDGDDEIAIRQRAICRAKHRAVRRCLAAETSFTAGAARAPRTSGCVRRPSPIGSCARRLAEDDESVAVKDGDHAALADVGCAKNIAQLVGNERRDDDSVEFAVRRREVGGRAESGTA